MLKLMAMNLYDMEAKSRMENLVAFKKVYTGSLKAVTLCLEKFFPSMRPKDVQEFSLCAFPFSFWRLSLYRGYGKTKRGDGAGPCPLSPLLYL